MIKKYNLFFIIIFDISIKKGMTINTENKYRHFIKHHQYIKNIQIDAYKTKLKIAVTC